jgi:hypothetical protein
VGASCFENGSSGSTPATGFTPAAPSASSQHAGRVPSCGSQMYPQVINADYVNLRERDRLNAWELGGEGPAELRGVLARDYGDRS